MSLENGDLAQCFVKITKSYRQKEAAPAEEMKARFQSESDQLEQKRQKAYSATPNANLAPSRPRGYLCLSAQLPQVHVI